MEVIGYEIKNGVFKNESGKELSWEHVYLYVTQDISQNGKGRKGEFLKVKDRKKLPVPLDNVIFSKVKQVYYDKYGNILDIIFED